MRFSSTILLESGRPFLEPFNWILYRAVEAGLIQKYYVDSRYCWRIQGLSNMSDSGGEDYPDGRICRV
jgi:hypothetical protein